MKIPDDWRLAEISDVADINPESLGKNTPDNYAFYYLDLSCVNEGRVNLPAQKTTYINSPSRARRCVSKNDILMSMVRPTLNGHAYFPESPEDVIASTGFAVIRCSDAVPSYIFQCLFGTLAVSQIERLLVGSNYPAINSSDVEEMVVAMPNSLAEQRKIANILTTWDKALETLDALIVAKARQKQALIQQLLSGKRRIPNSTGKWRSTALSKVIEPIVRPTLKPTKPFLAAGIRSHGRGVFLKPNFAPADIALDELYEIKAGDLIVNITFAWEGAAAIVPEEADGALVSHRFPTYTFREGKASPSFFRHYIRTKRFVFECGLASPGGAGRNRVLKKSDFLKIELMLPPIEEQEAIGAILDTCDAELDLLRRQRDAIDLHKRGLMQRLLTGKIRVTSTPESNV